MDSKISNGELKHNLVICQTALGVELRGTPIKLSRLGVVFEIISPGSILRLSEVLADFKIIFHEHTIYSGKGTVQNIMNLGQTVLCSVALNEGSWTEVQFDPVMTQTGELKKMFNDFFTGWQKSYRVDAAYKTIVGDILTFLADLRPWIDQIESGIRPVPGKALLATETSVAEKLSEYVLPPLNELFEKFETVASRIESDFEATHQVYVRRQLHPWLLCSPFLHRTFTKPLGYAGDYEMVNMIMRPPFQGDSLYAKVINHWFLLQAPAEAHRNRIKYLVKILVDAAAEAARAGRKAKVLNLGCGPAHEVLAFLRESPLADYVDFTLLDFNQETIADTGAELERTKKTYQRTTGINMLKKSVNQVLKESERKHPADQKYDLVYCAGLYDYLFDPVCQRLNEALYKLVSPGGLLVTTNVDSSNPRRFIMNHIMDWHLIYRNAAQMQSLKPTEAPAEDAKVTADITGVNIYFQARKPS